MSQQTLQKQFIESVLKHWGLWVRDGRTWPNALGYGSETVEARLMAEGAGACSSTGTKGSKVPLWTNWDRQIIQADKAINEMPNNLRLVVSAHWVKGLSLRDIASRTDRPRSEVRQLHENAMYWLDGRIGRNA